MIDIHSHIIAGVDDGSKNKETTIEMLKRAEKDGTKKIVATPHYCIGYGETSYTEVKEMVVDLNKDVDELGLDIKIYHGQEVYFSNNMVRDYEEGVTGTINDSKYMLFELPMGSFDEETFDVLYEMQLKGLKLVMAHPERYKPIIDNPAIINDFIEEGFLFQLNAGSIEGKFGKSVKKTAEILLENSIYNFIGSDAHDLNSRTTGISEALKTVSKLNKEAKEIFLDSAEKMLNNEEIEFIGKKIKGKKSLFSFLSKK